MTLETWQDRIAQHFLSLADRRTGTGQPIFALEHDLDSDEVNELSSMIRSRPRLEMISDRNWLLWVIYATEQGYSYSGEEYWRSFEEQTPRWEYRDRYRLVPWFRQFQQTYEGVVPTGPWASHFRIITWPITHAILPRYLQHHLARALYHLRFRLAHLRANDPLSVGRLLSAYAQQHTSSRFQEFLQQEELVGRIVLSLLNSGAVQASPDRGGPIYQRTLQRIVRDMEEVRSARTWLQETQRVVADRFVGIGRGRGPHGTSPLRPEDRETLNTTLHEIRSSLMLTHRGGVTWSVYTEITSFRAVATLRADIGVFLKRTRCRLNGADDFKPAGWTLSGRRKGVLRRWPDATKPLIQFDGTHGVIDNLVETTCRLSPGPIWLFRVARDGTAHEIIGRVVRPGNHYIILTTGELPSSHPELSACTIDCHGIRSFRLLMPSDVSAYDTRWLNQLGLQVARTIQVWPAGLPGRNWDGVGNSDWLTTEAPCFGMMHDHPVDAYALRIDHGAETVVGAGEVGHPVFVRLPPLTAGKHLLTVKARRSASLDSIVRTPAAEGFAELHVREPGVWAPGLVSHSGLTVRLDPEDADLDTFWRNEVDLSVLGPESHSVTVSVSLEGAGSRELLAERVGGPMNLPVKPRAWRSKFERFMDDPERVWAYLEAVSGRLTIDGEALGERSFQFEHSAVPLRWVLRRDHRQIIVRLIDDTGQDEEPEVQYYSMNRPLRRMRVTPQEALTGIAVDERQEAGGLFVAKSTVRSLGRDSLLLKPHSDAVVVSKVLPRGGFKSLSVNPTFSELREGTVTLADSLRLLTQWQDARRAGFVVNARHEQVIIGYVQAVYIKIFGQRWAKMEDAFRIRPGALDSVLALQRSVGNPQFSVLLQRNHRRMKGDIEEAAQWYADVASQYRVCTNKELCDFALRLASQPYGLSGAYGTKLDRLLASIVDNPTVLRGARLLAVLSASRAPNGSVRMLPEWKW